MNIFLTLSLSFRSAINHFPRLFTGFFVSVVMTSPATVNRKQISIYLSSAPGSWHWLVETHSRPCDELLQVLQHPSLVYRQPCCDCHVVHEHLDWWLFYPGLHCWPSAGCLCWLHNQIQYHRYVASSNNTNFNANVTSANWLCTLLQ